MEALIIIDLQNDFCPGGKLAVPKGDEIVTTINSLLPYFDQVIQTQDWHPQDHSSFASNQSGKSEYETVSMDYGEQVLWPDHCVQGTRGAEFHPDLKTNDTRMIVRKGFRQEIDSYSVFFENDHQTKTGLDGFLSSFGIKKLFLCGLATDFCVKWSALDALKLGYEVYLIDDAVKAIDLNGSEAAAIKEMKDAGVKFISSDFVKQELSDE
ncbi:MAG: bifunctional nicotinamidase/pyrazinamidase [Balneolaceae bacterium]|nr:bifunctional nicotinamidase/pyrazinamidase [Balneolaceae bacterium]MBO6546434.1 bifunctional nicotinamidase/pyrazinamidase [Balneolaceae bacterium]MBO6648793.1 bifunctional nicotinamidase/pyrazinamidase [Balneolaceae bacterium]